MTIDPDDYMCPNCVTPWKCNGPHTETAALRSYLAQNLPQGDQSGDVPILSLEERLTIAIAARGDRWIGEFVEAAVHSHAGIRHVIGGGLCPFGLSDEDFVRALEREAFGR